MILAERSGIAVCCGLRMRREIRNRGRAGPGPRSTVIEADRTGQKLATHMGESPRQSWVRTAVFLGMGYALVGILFAVPATHVQTWRLAAWGISAIGYAAHIAYERLWLRHSPSSAALHVALAVALGAFGLAVGANIHSLSSGSTNQHRQLLLVSLGIWPVVTALPAFLVAFGINMALARALGSAQSQ
jgi:hypothetical protein